MNKQQHIVSIVFVALMIAWGIGLHLNGLSQLPIVQWDESRLAINAAEMSQSGNWLMTTFKGQADLYNTKPPLMIWLQTLSIKCFGLSPLSIRLPSVLAGIATAMLVFAYTYKHSKNIVTSGFAMACLLSSQAWIQVHCSITGDYDALLSCLLLLSMYYWSNHLDNNRSKYWYLHIGCMALAIMTKSSAALVFFPIITLQTFWQKRSWSSVWKSIVSILLACIPMVLYVCIRESMQTGYIKASLYNDYLGRLNDHIDGHQAVWYYYFQQLMVKRFSIVLVLLPLSLFGLRLNIKPATLRLLFCSLGYLLIISIAQTKIEWYDSPVIPLLAISVALLCHEWYFNLQKTVSKILVITICLLPLSIACIQKHDALWNKTKLDLDYTHYELSHLLDHYKGKDSLYLIAPAYAPEFEFYTYKNPLIVRKPIQNLKQNDHVALGNYGKDSIDLLYHYKLIHHSKNANIIKIQP